MTGALRPAARLAGAAAGVLALAWLAGPAAAQHGAAGQAPDVPPGPGTIRVRVLHPAGPAATAGLDVALYALSPDGTPGLRSGVTDDSGAVSFTGVSTAADVVYLVGARFRDIPFGERVAFPRGEETVDVQIPVSDPLVDPSVVHPVRSEWRIEWLGAELWVHEEHELENTASQVVQIPPDRREQVPPVFVGRLPEGAEGFSPALGTFSDGLERRGDEIVFWGPVYPGRQTVRYQSRRPIAEADAEADEGREVTLRERLPRPTPDLEVLVPEDGPAVEVPGAREAEPVERDGRRYRVLDLGPRRAGDVVTVQVAIPPASHDVGRIRIPRADLWVELDDAAAVVSAEVNLDVSGDARLVGRPGEPLLRFPLPPGAQMLGASTNAATIGLTPATGADGSPALALSGPLAPGESGFGVRYRIPLDPPGSPLTLPVAMPLEVEVLNVLVADTGVVVDDARLHRRRPVRSGTRTYLHREGFHVEPDETPVLTIRPIQRAGTPRWASVGIVGLAALVGAGFLLSPLRRSGETPTDREDVRPATSRERDGVIESLRDLEDDFETGKVAAGDYEQMRAELRARAVELMRRERDDAAASEVTATEDSASAPPPAAAAAGFCPHCGAGIQAAWRFCAGCGAELPAAAPRESMA